MTRGYLAGAAAIALAWTISAIKTKDVHPFALARDRNGNISLSQLQFMLFTGICLFAIVAVEVERFSIGAGPLSLTGIPTNLLLLMGFSVGTTAVTKGIAVSYLNDGRISQDDRSSMTADRQGQPNLVKIQMLLWTLVSAGLYLLQVIRFIEQRSFATSGASFALPDVDGALLVLMGVSHGAYVTQKLVARSVGPFVNSITPSPAPVGSEVLIAGGMLGNGQGGAAISLEAKGTLATRVVPTGSILAWSDSVIRFSITEGELAPGDYRLRIVANGQASEPVEFRIEAAK